MYIAIIEDDPSQARLMTIWLEKAGHACKIFPEGQIFLDNANNEQFDLLIIDWVLPDILGDDILRWVRNNLGWEIPVIFMTFRDSSEDIAKILRLGADDYISKSVESSELLARISSLQRRARFTPPSNNILNVGDYCVDSSQHKLSYKGQDIKLTPKEFKLAQYLFKNINQLRTRADLLANVWGRNAEISTRTVDIHISRLRKKLFLEQATHWKLESVSSLGYRLTTNQV
ncbi:MAG: response regulator transcription factor [Gammaproteobacteria bacterium]|nr:response regulator transcription factor [Gammaproteobacteria bacterium]